MQICLMTLFDDSLPPIFFQKVAAVVVEVVAAVEEVVVVVVVVVVLEVWCVRRCFVAMFHVPVLTREQGNFNDSGCLLLTCQQNPI